MKKNYTLIPGILILMLALILAACSASVTSQAVIEPTKVENTPTVQPTAEQQTYDDPFAYCAAVGTIDSLDTRYTGPQITDSVINGFIAAAGLEQSTEPMEMFAKTTIWRCMNAQVYACNYGANLPCSSKANTDKTPTLAMEDYCKANLDAEFIPESVTGHSTIFSWHCVKDTPELLDQIENVDASGYLAQIWYLISPNASPRPESTDSAEMASGSNQILFSSNRGGAYDDLYLLNIASSQVTRLTNGDSNTFAGPFSPDGSQILFTGYGLVSSYVGVMSADGTNPLDLTHSQVDEGFPTWSPDGKYIAFTSRRDGNNEIYVMNADGSNLKRLTNKPKDDFAPSWSPDGSQIAFASDRDAADGIYSIYVMNSDGSNVRRLTNNNGIDYTPSWSPDGTQIAFRSVQNGTSDIYIINADGSNFTNLTNYEFEDWSPAWSPDGKQIAFQTNRDGNWEIYTMNADGTDPHNHTNDPADDQMPYWAPITQIANPASANCINLGGKLIMENRGDLGEFGVCYFEDNRQCEEWALFRGDCPAGGLKVTGYITEAARFCAITGGEYAITGNSGANNEQGTCTFKNGNTCDVWKYYTGECSPNG